MNTLKTFGLATALTAVAANGVWAQAQHVTITAAPANFPGDAYGDTAQVGSKGPGSSQSYLDVESGGNGQYATFGVVDFTNNFVGFPAQRVTGIAPTITLDMTDEAYKYTVPGKFNFYLADSNVSLTSLKYDSTDTTATAGIGSQLGSLIFLGQGNYTSTSKTVAGGDDIFTLTLPASAQSAFVSALNSGGSLRLAIAGDPSTPNGVASFAGAANGDGAPSLSFTATTKTSPVPEASTTVSFGLLLALGLGSVAAARRRRVASND